MTTTCWWCISRPQPAHGQLMPRCVCLNTLARPVTRTVWQDDHASESANLCNTCKYGIAYAVDADDDAAAAAAAIIATDADDTVDVVASTDGLSLLKFNKSIRALKLPNNFLG